METKQTKDDVLKDKKKKFIFKVPHTYVLLFGIIVFATLLTYVLPAGEFDRVENEATGRIVIEPNSFQIIEPNPQGIFDIFKAVPTGMENVGYIIFFVFIVGGAFGIIQATGAIDAGIGYTIKKMHGKEILIIPIFMFLFSLGGATMGLAEELLPFYPIAVALAIRLGFDSITGTSLVLLGSGAGFSGAFLNPFTIGISHGIAELPMFSGMGLRFALYGVLVLVTILYVYRHAMKVKKNPEKSPMYELDKKRNYQLDVSKLGDFSKRHRLVLAIFVIGLLVIAYGVTQSDWYITELAATFLILGILAGLVGGLNINRTAEEFVKGASAMTYGALVIGVASGISVILSDGRIMDTIVNSLAQSISYMPTLFAPIGMFISQSLLNFFIPSGSGQAAATMPIMIPVADLVGMTRQTAVLAFQLGDGITNVFNPTSAYFMAGLALAGIPWDKWVKWVWPLILIWSIVACVFLIGASLINYGPF